MIKVAIVEDNKTIRLGLREFINDTDGYKCIADYSDCESLFADISHIKPDIILMDIILPGISGIEGIKKIKKINGDVKIIILTIYSENENLFEALSAGASGYLEKKTPPSQMIKLIDEVYHEQSYMNSYVARSVLNYFSGKKNTSDKQKSLLDQDEFEILNNLVEGKSPKAIADFLEITRDDVHFHFYNIYQKLHNQFEVNSSSLA